MFEPKETGEPLMLGIIVIICTAIVVFFMVMSVDKINETIKAQPDEFIQKLHTELSP